VGLFGKLKFDVKEGGPGTNLKKRLSSSSKKGAVRKRARGVKVLESAKIAWKREKRGNGGEIGQFYTALEKPGGKNGMEFLLGITKERKRHFGTKKKMWMMLRSAKRKGGEERQGRNERNGRGKRN